MFVRLSDTEMLKVWRRCANLEPPLNDASIERFDGLEVDTRLLAEMRAWYLDYLANAPISMVPVTDITDRISVLPGHAEGQWSIAIRGNVARLTSLTLKDFGPVPIVNPLDPQNAEIMRRIRNKFVRLGSNPVLINIPGLETAIIHSPQMPVVVAAKGVEITDDEVYVVDERMLAKLPATP